MPAQVRDPQYTAVHVDSILAILQSGDWMPVSQAATTLVARAAVSPIPLPPHPSFWMAARCSTSPAA
jgi:hypothetical protein